MVTTVGPSATAELAWLLDLLVQDAPYAEPALDELDRSLLPGIAGLRGAVRGRFTTLWSDGVGGCPELIPVAEAAGCLEDTDLRRFLTRLSSLPGDSSVGHDLLSEPARERQRVRRRLERLGSEIRLRRAYRDLLAGVWETAAPAWTRRGHKSAASAAAEWSARLKTIRSIQALVRLMPPRHPLARRDRAAAARLLERRSAFSLVPLYFCMSGGQLVDLDDRLHIGVPASELELVRKTRDAAFVADRARVLSEPTRVRILIHLLSQRSGVMEVSRALNISQPAVSEHVRILAATGLIAAGRRGGRTVYSARPLRLERWIEDARATLARWV